MTSELLLKEPLVVALPPTHSLTRRRHISLRALANESFVFVLRDAVPVFHDAVLRICRQAGFVPHAPHEVDHVQMMLAMVAGGSGISLVPAGARHVRQHRVVYRPIQETEDHSIETVITWRRDDTSPTLKAFVDFVRRGYGRHPRGRRRG